MSGSAKTMLFISILITAAAVITWQATGGDYYTKYEVIEQVDIPVDQDDPLAAAGFYDSDFRTETVTKNEFRMGLLPTPSKILDKHLVSLISIVIPFWLVTIFLLWRSRRGRRSEESS